MIKKTIIVTGGFGTIGSVLSNSLLKQGHKVIAVDTKLKKLKFINSNFIPLKANLNKENEIKKLISICIKRFKKVDALVHCAYPKTKDWGTSFEKLKQKSLEKNLSNNLGASIILSKLVIKQFLKQKNGNLIFFSSIYGSSIPNFSDYPKNKIYSPIEYSAIKSGIISITKYLAKLYKKKNIRINCISPGGLNDKQANSFKKKYKQHCNSKGLLEANDLIGLVEFLINDQSKTINGQNITIDDGWSL